jgi:hypothetical protein
VEGYLKNTKGKQSLLAKEVTSGDNVVISYFLHNGQEKCRGVTFLSRKSRGFSITWSDIRFLKPMKKWKESSTMSGLPVTTTAATG